MVKNIHMQNKILKNFNFFNKSEKVILIEIYSLCIESQEHIEFIALPGVNTSAVYGYGQRGQRSSQ